MSTTSSPVHMKNYERDSFYDPDFTVEISNRMRVPDKISLNPGSISVDGDQTDRLTSHIKGKGSNDWMHVPDRIVVRGGNQFEEGREILPENRFENSIIGDDPVQAPVQLMTPPRNLTLNEHAYPSVEPSEAGDDVKRQNIESSARRDASFYGNDLSGGHDNFNDSFYTKPNGGEVDLNTLRKQVRLLNRRVSALERDRESKKSQEFLLYSLGAIYFIIKGLSWFNKSW